MNEDLQTILSQILNTISRLESNMVTKTDFFEFKTEMYAFKKEMYQQMVTKKEFIELKLSVEEGHELLLDLMSKVASSAEVYDLQKRVSKLESCKSL